MNETELKRLSDCEVLLSKYFDQLRKYSEQVLSLNSRFASKEELEKSHSDLNKINSAEMDDARKSIAKFEKELSNMIIQGRNLENQIYNQSSVWKNHDNVLNDHALNLKDSKDSKQKLDEQLKKLSEICKDNSQSIIEFREFIVETYKIFSSNEKEFSFLEKEIENVNLELKSQKLELLNFEKENERLEFLCISLNEHLVEQEKKISNECASQIQQNNRIILDKIEQIKAPESVVTIDIQPKLNEFKTEMQNWFNASLIDVSNAKTKADINEMQLKVMDKKLENIYLLLKKLDLTQ